MIPGRGDYNFSLSVEFPLKPIYLKINECFTSLKYFQLPLVIFSKQFRP